MTDAATYDDLLAVIEREPDLSSWGIGPPSLYRRNGISAEEFKKHREELKSELGMFQMCCAYLSLCAKTGKFKPKAWTSYGLKHVIEGWAGEYIMNGSLIAAIIHLGLKHERLEGNPNVSIAISSPGADASAGGRNSNRRGGRRNQIWSR